MVWFCQIKIQFILPLHSRKFMCIFYIDMINQGYKHSDSPHQERTYAIMDKLQHNWTLSAEGIHRDFTCFCHSRFCQFSLCHSRFWHFTFATLSFWQLSQLPFRGKSKIIPMLNDQKAYTGQIRAIRCVPLIVWFASILCIYYSSFSLLSHRPCWCKQVIRILEFKQLTVHIQH